MGFGSYDESEQGNQEYDADLDDDEAVTTARYDHEGEVSYEFDETSSDELLDQFKRLKGE